ncbi:MAG TPA: IS110 family transposase, partial [Actinomycetes bacterium]
MARRHRHLGREIAELEQRMLTWATTANPALLAIKGIGPVIGAQLLITAGDNPDRLRSSASFAALCGTAPIPVSSGRTDRHRLSRGGDRHANAALHHIVKNRMTNDTRTRAYR